MSATPMKLEDALRFSGYTIDAYEFAGTTITTASGSIIVPAMILSRLTWQRTNPAPLGAAFYLDKLPTFHTSYAPVQLSLILDRFRSRRLGYDTPDEFALAVRRWGALNLGAMSTLTRRYLSVATDLPLDEIAMNRDTVSEGETTGTAEMNSTATSSDTTASNTKGRDAQSEFPQGTLAGNLDYASGAVDRVADSDVTGTGEATAERTDNTTGTENRTENSTERGRSGRSVMELLELQRAAFLNVDAELLEGMESLFLGVFDRSESDTNTPGPYGYRWGW